jgi:hypothetical protein
VTATAAPPAPAGTAPAAPGTAPGASRNRSRRGLIIGIAVGVALVLVGLIAGQSSTQGAPFSPASTSSDGLKGLVLLMQSFGADVHTNLSVPDSGTRVAFLARDSLDDQAEADLRTWVRGGGTLVLADPSSPLASPTSGEVGGFALVRGQCDLDGVDDVSRIEIGGLNNDLEFTGGERFRAGDHPSCFGDGDTAYVVEQRLGEGKIISVGSPNLFANGYLQSADDSVLAMRLLQPGGSQTVAILDAGATGSGRTTLIDLISDRVIQATIQLGIAFLIYALWRARRLGRPVVERQPVAIAGSQLVEAVGALEHRARATDRAGAAIRHDVRRIARERYGLAPRVSGTMLSDVVAERTGLDRVRVAYALSDSPVLDETTLVALTNELDTIRKEIVHGR